MGIKNILLSVICAIALVAGLFFGIPYYNV